jgi:hypothetical protein
MAITPTCIRGVSVGVGGGMMTSLLLDNDGNQPQFLSGLPMLRKSFVSLRFVLDGCRIYQTGQL